MARTCGQVGNIEVGRTEAARHKGGRDRLEGAPGWPVHPDAVEANAAVLKRRGDHHRIVRPPHLLLRPKKPPLTTLPPFAPFPFNIMLYYVAPKWDPGLSGKLSN